MTILIDANDINGESWETRPQMNLTPGIHYLSITGNAKKVCSDLADKVTS